mmetsp:Transcript_24077/g.62038  ORF Transcript_24077/g.62038 Transcript_24077/m.62038 type:complete len:456 (+) Transcript_24077:524-1891(+)
MRSSSTYRQRKPAGKRSLAPRSCTCTPEGTSLPARTAAAAAAAAATTSKLPEQDNLRTLSRMLSRGVGSAPGVACLPSADGRARARRCTGETVVAAPAHEVAGAAAGGWSARAGCPPPPGGLGRAPRAVPLPAAAHCSRRLPISADTAPEPCVLERARRRPPSGDSPAAVPVKPGSTPASHRPFSVELRVRTAKEYPLSSSALKHSCPARAAVPPAPTGAPAGNEAAAPLPAELPLPPRECSASHSAAPSATSWSPHVRLAARRELCARVAVAVVVPSGWERCLSTSNTESGSSCVRLPREGDVRARRIDAPQSIDVRTGRPSAGSVAATRLRILADALADEPGVACAVLDSGSSSLSSNSVPAPVPSDRKVISQPGPCSASSCLTMPSPSPVPPLPCSCPLPTCWNRSPCCSARSSASSRPTPLSRTPMRTTRVRSPGVLARLGGWSDAGAGTP